VKDAFLTRQWNVSVAAPAVIGRSPPALKVPTPANAPLSVETSHIKKSLVICSTARSGSTWLDALVASTGVMGNPDEYLQPLAMRRISGIPETATLTERFARAVQLGMTENGIFGVKLLHWEMPKLIAVHDPVRAFPNPYFVHLTRRDVLGQAISNARALQTGAWQSFREEQAEPQYSAKMIDESIAHLTTGNAKWLAYFARNGIVPLSLVYEDVVKDPDKAVAAIAQHMQIDGEVRIGSVPAQKLTVQRDGRNEEWRRRFLADYAAVGSSATSE
jgi:LPS sulfotransferase NodH